MNKTLPTLGIACALACAGCLSTVDSVENAEKAYIPDEELRLHVETDASTPIKVTNLVTKTDPNNGFKTISVQFTNRSTSPQSASYQCEWYDEAGMPVPTSLTHWAEIRLAGRDSQYVNFTAPNAIAKDYKIRLLEKP